MVKCLNAFLILGYTEEEKLVVVDTGRDEPFKTAQDAQYWIDDNEPTGRLGRWFVVQSLDTDQVDMTI